MNRRPRQSVDAALESWERLGSARQLLLALAPVALVFGSLAPWWPLARALARTLAIPDGTPVIEHPNGLVWLSFVLVAALVLMLIGFSLGVILNVLVARLVFGWPMAAIVEAGICPPLVSFFFTQIRYPHDHDRGDLS